MDTFSKKWSKNNLAESSVRGKELNLKRSNKCLNIFQVLQRIFTSIFIHLFKILLVQWLSCGPFYRWNEFEPRRILLSELGRGILAASVFLCLFNQSALVASPINLVLQNVATVSVK